MSALPRSQSTGAPALPPHPALPPLPPLPPRPASLTPGRQRGQSISNNTSNLFFEQQSNYAFTRRTSDAALSPTQSFYSAGMQRHTQSYTAGVPRQQLPLLPRKPTELQQGPSSPPPVPPKFMEKKPSYSFVPTVPPKISLYSQSIPGPVSNTWPTEKSPQVTTPPPSDEDKDLEIAMLLSEAAANQRKQEEEDLANALEESRILSLQSSSAMSSPIAMEVIAPNNVAHWDFESSAPSDAQSLPTSPIPSRPIDLNRNRTLMKGEGSYSASPQMLAAQLSDDEGFARRLTAGDEPECVEEHKSPLQENAHGFAPSLYSDALSNIVNSPGRSTSASASLSVDHSSSQPEITAESPLSRGNSVKSASSQQSAGSDARSPLSPTSPGPLGGSSPVPKPATTDTATLSPAWPSAALEKRSLSVLSSQSTMPLNDGAPIINANQFVEEELLFGVSLGFTPPAISTMSKPMSGPMPNIITLPYGKSPPLHLQAPSWRHLLKLMARLSGTRIEPTLEAQAVVNGELKLRTVVQFIKVHHLAQEWRMLLYLTIDHPVPTNSSNAWKYTNGDVSTLPYSYTLSVLPALFRDGADSAMASYYVIPSTPKTPYPTLPITFPNMAMYLQSALEDSRRAMHDSSSGLRKLAKSVDSYYPNEHDFVGVEEGPEKRSFGGVLKKVIGRGNKQSRGNRGGNEDVYEFVTPFVADEWG